MANAKDFRAALSAAGLSQRSFIRLVESLGCGEAPPTVSTVNRWAKGRLDVPGYAFAILSLFGLLDEEARASLLTGVAAEQGKDNGDTKAKGTQRAKSDACPDTK